jgi:predicted lipid carrier protein YhbT
MVDLTTEFFERLVGIPQPLLSRVTTTVRVDLEDGKSAEHWLMNIDQGRVSVTRRKAKADSILHMDRALFERLITGRANAMASVLRGLLTVEGDTTHLVAVQRIFPGPPHRKPPAPIPSSEVRGPTSAVAQKPPKTAPKRAVAAKKAPAKRAVTAKTTPKTATKARAKRSAS